VLTSPDGVAWEERGVGTTATLAGVAWTGSRFVAVGERGLRFESADGLDWTAVPSGTTNDLFHLRSFASGDVFATGRYGTIVRAACTAERSTATPVTSRPRSRGNRVPSERSPL
jgi:photosystem II stability/assembly factor-like uncharacterized protein